MRRLQTQNGEEEAASFPLRNDNVNLGGGGEASDKHCGRNTQPSQHQGGWHSSRDSQAVTHTPERGEVVATCPRLSVYVLHSSLRVSEK